MQNWNARGRVNAIGARLAGALLSIGLTTANVDADIFSLWLERDLIPRLPVGAVLVVDNTSFLRRADTITLIARAGHSLEYLPPCSPDLNPIEHKWTQAKERRRKTEADVEELFRNQF